MSGKLRSIEFFYDVVSPYSLLAFEVRMGYADG